MRVEKKRARASRQARAHAPKNNASLAHRRLTDEEWREMWLKPGSIWWVAALAPLLAAAAGVI